MPTTDDILERIRHAAFQLRETDPAAAARELRKLVRQGGDTEALAHGALGEILLEDFDDVDGSLHHFRRLLVLAPGLPAAEMGLARALARNGEFKSAQEAYGRAVSGLESTVREGLLDESPPAGLEEAALSVLELCTEERELLKLHDDRTPPLTRPDLALFESVERARLFDAGRDEADPELDDWTRYATLIGVMNALEGKLPRALAEIDRLAALAPLEPSLAGRIRAVACERAEDFVQAAALAMEALGPVDSARIDHGLQAAHYLAEAGRAIEARGLLQKLRGRIVREGLDAPGNREHCELIDEALLDMAGGQLVSLRKTPAGA